MGDRCRPQGSEWIADNAHAAAFLDGYPVSEGHTLIVPRQHIGSIFELGGEAQAGVWNLVAEVRDRLRPMLKALQNIQGGRMARPSSEECRPNRDYLAERFEDFKRVA